MSSKKVQQEAKRLTRLRKDLENQQKKLDQDKAKLRAEKKEVAALRRKYEQSQKEMKAKKNKLDQDKRRLDKSTPRASPRSQISKSAGNAQLSRELEDAKSRLQKKSADLRNMRKQLEELKQRNKLLERQAKSGSRGRANTTSDKKVRQLQREISVLKKKIKLLLRDLEKQRRYYQTQLKRFKNQQDKWLARQREARDKRGITIKYVFIDDIKVIKRYRKKKGRVKIITRDGGEVILRDTDIIDATEVEEAVDDEQDVFVQELEAEFKKTKRKKKKKKKKADGTIDDAEVSAYEDDDEDDGYDEEKDNDYMPATLAELNAPSAADVDDEEDDDDVDDIDDADIPTEVNMADQILDLIAELESRTRDLHSINDIYENESKDQQDDALKDLLETVTGRHEEWTEKLVKQNFEMKDELPTISKAWQDEIYKVCTTVAAASQPQKSENYGFSMGSASSQDNEKQEEIDNLVVANKELLVELLGRVGDLKHLNKIFFADDSKEDEPRSSADEMTALLGDLDDRHARVLKSINSSTGKNDPSNLQGLVPTNNRDWRKEIDQSLQSTETNKQEVEAMVSELTNRTKDLENISAIINGDEPMSMFDDVIAENEKRHASMKPKNINRNQNGDISIYVNSGRNGGSQEPMVNDERAQKDLDNWVGTIRMLQKQRKDSVEAKAKQQESEKASGDSKEEMTGDAKLKGVVNDSLIGEMNDRRKDLLKITELSKLEAIPNEEIDNIIEEVSARHEKQKNELRSCMKQNSLVDDKDCQKLLENIEGDNKEWVALFQNNLKNDERTKLNLKKRNELYMNELNGRIADLIKVKNIADKKDKGTASADELQTTLDGLVDSAQERQKENQGEFKDTINEDCESKTKDKDTSVYNEFVTNDNDWIDVLGNASESVIGIKPQEARARVLSDADVLSGVVVESKEDDDDKWWLDKDADRVDFIDSIKPNDKGEEETQELKEIGSYLDCVLGDIKDDDAITPLYIPIPEKDTHHVLSVLYDGVLICDLINQIEPNFIDPRSVNKPDALDPRPLSKQQVAENMQLVMSSMKSMGVELKDYSVDPWFDNELICPKLIEMIAQLADHNIKANVMNPTKHPELMRLAKNNEIETKEIDTMKGNEWVGRWINNTLNRPVKDDIKTQDFNRDLFEVMGKLYPKFNPGCDNAKYDENEDAACEYMVKFAKNNLKLNSNVKASDLIENNRKCQEVFASELFDEDSGLSQLNKKELREYQGFVEKDNHSPEAQTLSWINAMLPPGLRIKHLYRDLSDGIVLLKLMERANPGCVQWTKKNVRQPPKNRFDKFQNCNYAMNNVIQQFPFARIVGAKGEDFVNAEQRIHQKQVHSFLWQLMRYHATKQLSQLSFGGKQVTEADIVQWANLKVSEFADRVSTNLSSFKDPQLTTVVFYCELLEAIVPDSLNMSIVHTDLPPLKDFRKPDKYMPKRLENARYCMSMVRRLGGELFVMPEDLVCREQKAVLSVFAAIMTIDMTGPATSKMTDIEDAALNAGHVPV